MLATLPKKYSAFELPNQRSGTISPPFGIVSAICWSCFRLEQMISRTRPVFDGRSVTGGGGGAEHSPANGWSGPSFRCSRASVAVALAEVCAAAGLDPRGARLLRFVNNAVFRLREHDVVVRIVLAPSLAHRARAVVDTAHWLAENDVPAVRLFPGVSQPVVAGDYVA